MYLLYSVASSAAEQLKPHLADIAALVAGVLVDQQSSIAPFYAIKTMAEVVYFVGDDVLKPVQQMVPHILEVIQKLIQVDQVMVTLNQLTARSKTRAQDYKTTSGDQFQISSI
jgi:hypothetical protein